MSIIIDRLFTEPNVENGFKNNEIFYKKHTIKQYINVANFYPAVISMVILRLFNVSTYIIIILAIIIYIYTTNKSIVDNQKKLDFLNSIIHNNNEEPFNTESYLDLDPKIVDFYYNNRWYIDYNLTAYRKSLEASNNLLKIVYNLRNNLMNHPEHFLAQSIENNTVKRSPNTKIKSKKTAKRSPTLKKIVKKSHKPKKSTKKNLKKSVKKSVKKSAKKSVKK